MGQPSSSRRRPPLTIEDQLQKFGVDAVVLPAMESGRVTATIMYSVELRAEIHQPLLSHCSLLVEFFNWKSYNLPQRWVTES